MPIILWKLNAQYSSIMVSSRQRKWWNQFMEYFSQRILNSLEPCICMCDCYVRVMYSFSWTWSPQWEIGCGYVYCCAPGLVVPLTQCHDNIFQTQKAKLLCYISLYNMKNPKTFAVTQNVKSPTSCFPRFGNCGQPVLILQFYFLEHVRIVLKHGVRWSTEWAERLEVTISIWRV